MRPRGTSLRDVRTAAAARSRPARDRCRCPGPRGRSRARRVAALAIRRVDQRRDRLRVDVRIRGGDVHEVRRVEQDWTDVMGLEGIVQRAVVSGPTLESAQPRGLDEKICTHSHPRSMANSAALAGPFAMETCTPNLTGGRVTRWCATSTQRVSSRPRSPGVVYAVIALVLLVASARSRSPSGSRRRRRSRSSRRRPSSRSPTRRRPVVERRGGAAGASGGRRGRGDGDGAGPTSPSADRRAARPPVRRRSAAADRGPAVAAVRPVLGGRQRRRDVQGRDARRDPDRRSRLRRQRSIPRSRRSSTSASSSTDARSALIDTPAERDCDAGQEARPRWRTSRATCSRRSGY